MTSFAIRRKKTNEVYYIQAKISLAKIRKFVKHIYIVRIAKPNARTRFK